MWWYFIYKYTQINRYKLYICGCFYYLILICTFAYKSIVMTDKKPYRKNLSFPHEIGNMVEEMSKETIRNHTDMIAFCIKEQYKVFKAK